MKSTGIQWLDRWRMRWRALRERTTLDREFQAELEFHRANLVEQHEREGLTRIEALRRVRLELGGPAQLAEEVRDQRGWPRLDRFRADTKLAFRTFRKFPGFTVTAVVTIALGMGANTSLFTLMHAVLTRPLPIADPSEVRNVYVELQHSAVRSSYGSSAFVSFREFQEIERGSTTALVGAVAEFDLAWRGATSRRVHAQLVSASLLPLIGARPVLGRFFAPHEATTPGSAAVVVLSHRFWQRELGGDSAIIGKSLTFNRTPFSVIGVADPTSQGPLMQRAQVWIPVTMQRLTRPGESLVDDPAAAWLQIFARKRPGVSDDALRAEMEVQGRRAVASHDSVSGTTTTVVEAAFLNMPEFSRQFFPAVGLLWIAFALILVVSCANVANMLLARGWSRQREIAVRLALGAGRRRILGQLLTESAWLGVLGGGLGLLVTFGAARLVPALLPADFDIQLALTPDRAVLAFTAIVSVVSGLAFGLLPAIQVTRLDLTPGLKSEGLSAAGAPRARLQQTLIGLQVAVCVVLLVNAGLVIRSFTTVLATGVGKPLDHLLIASFDLRQQQYDAARGTEFFRRMTERIDALPAVVRSGPTILDPELDSANNLIGLGDSSEVGGPRIQVSFDEVGAGYFAAVGLRLLAGRTFTEPEVRTNAPVVVVDQRFADGHFNGRAVGKRLWLADNGGRRLHEIVGIVSSTLPLTFWSRVLPTYYVPIAGLRYLEAKLLVRYRGAAAPVSAEIRRAAEALDRDVSPSVKTIEENVGSALLPARILSLSLSALGALALALASVGLFGVIGFLVGRRTREIAIRMAVGASPSQILGLVLRQAIGPVGGGLVAGLGLAIGGGLLIRSGFHGLSPLDPVPIGLMLVLVATSSGIAFWVPARRATAVRPATVLRVD